MTTTVSITEDFGFPFHDEEDRPATLTTHEGLATYLKSPIPRPEVLTIPELNAKDRTARTAYNRRRLMFLSGGITLDTPNLAQAKVLLYQAMTENMGRNSGHAGVLMDGASTLGKTTIAKAMMGWTMNHYSRRYPDWQASGRIPVVYIEVPAASTGKLLIKTFAEFLGIPVRSGDSMGDIRTRIVSSINRADTQLIVVDELQNLAGRGTGNGESVDLLKNLHNDISATFMYAGIEVKNSPLMAGPRGRQMQSRFSMLEMDTFNWSDKDDRQTWKALVSAFESQLPLLNHELGSLTRIHQYLYERTGGSIGSLGKLLTGVATQVILGGNPSLEFIDERSLNAYRLDHTAELFYRNVTAKRSAR